MTFPIPDAALSDRITPSQEDCIYAAGFFDGEGTVFIAANHKPRRAKGTVYNMRVMASQVDPTPLRWMQQRWGGTLIQRPGRNNANPCWVWHCFARQAARFLRDILPYLICKDGEALIAIEFQDSIFQPGAAGHTEEYRQQQGAYREQLMELKQDKHRIAI